MLTKYKVPTIPTIDEQFNLLEVAGLRLRLSLSLSLLVSIVVQFSLGLTVSLSFSFSLSLILVFSLYLGLGLNLSMEGDETISLHFMNEGQCCLQRHVISR